MIKHTHHALLTRAEFGGEYKDSFLFTPSSPGSARAEAVSRVCRERNVDEGYFTIVVTEMPNAAATRARGQLVEKFGRRCYELDDFSPSREQAAGRAVRR